LLRRQATCLYNAIDLERFGSAKADPVEKRRSLRLPVDALVIGTVGRLTEQKGYGFLVEAAAPVLQRLPDAYFLIVGDGELRQTLMDQASRLGIASRVVFTGPRSDVEELLMCMDLFVSSSLWEGLPTAIMESMAAGVPVVATDIPGTRELIQNQVTGWLSPAANSQALADTIIAALNSPALRREIARRASEAIQRFSIAAVAERYEALYLAAYDPKSTLSSPTSSI
jgi:glycosyltransferase involved in cell wall biosynthesis